MRISAVVGAYNAERYVAAAVQSILAQTLPASEIIVVDDGSTDGTREALRAFGDSIKLIEAPHRGAPSAFAEGVEAVSGDLLAFNDADDLWAPTKLASLSNVLTGDPDLEAVFGDVQQFVSPEDSEAVSQPLAPQAGISKIGMLIHRSAFLRVGSFDRSLQMIEFPDWYARALIFGLRFARLREVVAFRRLHAGNSGRTLRSVTHSEQLLVLKRRLDARRNGSERNGLNEQT